jgi:hypothetical protein
MPVMTVMDRSRRRVRKSILRGMVIAPMLLVAGLQALPGGASGDATANPHGLGYRGDPASVKAASGTSNLVDHGGKVLPASNTYAIWWGSSGSWAPDVQSGMAILFNGLNHSNLLSIGLQYMRAAGISSSFQGSTSDPSSPPRKVTPSILGSEILKLYNGIIDPNGVYFVFTSTFPKGGGFCAWHSYASVGGQNIAVAYMPNTSGVAGCDPGNLYGSTASEGLRSLANVTSHEFMEAITDPVPSSTTYGWVDSSGSEIGDKCAWTFGGPVTLSNSSGWQLQQEWSNAVSGCVNG